MLGDSNYLHNFSPLRCAPIPKIKTKIGETCQWKNQKKNE